MKANTSAYDMLHSIELDVREEDLSSDNDVLEKITELKGLYNNQGLQDQKRDMHTIFDGLVSRACKALEIAGASNTMPSTPIDKSDYMGEQALLMKSDLTEVVHSEDEELCGR
jgi:hypothetical protein